MDAAVKLDHVLLAVDGEHDVNAMVEIVAPELERADAREPLRLALVVDRSGSMAGRKLEVAKRCASWLVARLDPRDELALVDYDDEVRLLAPLAPPGVEHRAAIGRIHAGGSTNLSGGWLKGVEALGRTNGAGPRKALLLSDGLANVGITEPGVLTALAARVSEEGIGTTTIGFGEDFDEELMTALAEAGGGLRALRRDARRGACDLLDRARRADVDRRAEREPRDQAGAGGPSAGDPQRPSARARAGGRPGRAR